MNNIEEYPILDTIANNQFHSCILTTYSFNFNYFNHSALSKLSSAGVTNICVFVDDNMLQQTIGNISGYSGMPTKRYSINGIRSIGAFHPKISLFFGRNEKALITIGSGNITSAGHGSNQELWSAFHIDGKDDIKAPLFKIAWNYIQKISSKLVGISQRQIEWIRINTTWLNDIKDVDDSYSVAIGNDINAWFLNNRNGNILKKVYNVIDKENISKITLISPFFDKRSKVLLELRNKFPSSEIHTLIQPNTFEGSFSKDLFNKIHFHDWNSIKDKKSNRYLHAKFLHFKAKDSEYSLLGSANISSPGLGTENVSAKNEEFCVLLKRSRGDWLAEIGINEMGRELEYQEIEIKTDKTETDILEPHLIRYRISALDFYGNQLYIYIDKISSVENIMLKLFDGWSEEIFQLSMDKAIYTEGNCYKIPTSSKIEEVFYGQLYDSNGIAISNKQIIHHVSALYNTNPDPRTKNLQEVLDKIHYDETNIVEIFRYLNPDDVYVDRNKKDFTSRAKRIKRIVQEDKNIDKRLDYEDFIKMSSDYWVNDGNVYYYGTHPLERIYETLNGLFDKDIEKIDDELEEEEEDLLAGDNSHKRKEKEDSKPTPPQIKPRSHFENLQKSTFRFFNRYTKILDDQRAKNHIPNALDISLFTIALHLLLDFFNKIILVQDKKDPNGFIEKILLTSEGDYFNEKDFSSIVSDIIGKFTLLLKKNDIDSNDEYLKQRIDECKKSAYWHGICCIALLDKKNENIVSNANCSNIWKWELGMNLHLNLHSGNDNEATAIKEIDKRIKILSKGKHSDAKSKCLSLWKRIINEFEIFNKRENKVQLTYNVGDRIYLECVGFSHIYHIQPSKNYKDTLTLARAGYPEGKNNKDFISYKKFVTKFAKFINIDRI